MQGGIPGLWIQGGNTLKGAELDIVVLCILMDDNVFKDRSGSIPGVAMSKTVTLRLDDAVYERFKHLAEDDNRPLSNFIETAALRFIEEHAFVDEYEMAEIKGNDSLNRSLKRGLRDVKAQRGRFV